MTSWVTGEASLSDPERPFSTFYRLRIAWRILPLLNSLAATDQLIRSDRCFWGNWDKRLAFTSPQQCFVSAFFGTFYRSRAAHWRIANHSIAWRPLSPATCLLGCLKEKVWCHGESWAGSRRLSQLRAARYSLVPSNDRSNSIETRCSHSVVTLCLRVELWVRLWCAVGPLLVDFHCNTDCKRGKMLSCSPSRRVESQLELSFSKAASRLVSPWFAF